MNQTIMRLGLDLAKSVFVVYGVDERDKCQLRRQLRRAEVLNFFAKLEPCLVGMEAGSGAHYWARELCALGHDARIIDPRLVIPYRSQGRTGKNDSNDAAAICEAVGRPQMRFVPLKDADQQAVLLVHRIRRSRVREQTRLANQLRGLLAEFGIVLPRGLARLKREWPKMRQSQAERVPGLAWEELDILFSRLLSLHEEIIGYDRKLETHVHSDDRVKRLCEISGIGRITASALVATVGNGRDFKNGRQFAAWLGLVPRQTSSGGRNTLGGITKRGDEYLRTLLVHGARCELMHVHRRSDPKSRWAQQLKENKHCNKVAVALANKHARQAWAVLTMES
jgi:transposase